MEKFIFFGPDAQLLSELGDDQESSPALDLLALQNVAENVISDIKHVFAFGADQAAEDFAGSTRVNVPLFQSSEVRSDLEATGFSVDLAQNCAFAEEKRFFGVDDDRVEVSFPISVRVFLLWSVRKVEQERHDFVGEPIVAVGEQEDLRSRLPDAVQHERQARILLDIVIEVFDRLRFQFSVNVNPIDGVAHILEDRLVRQQQLAALHARLLSLIFRGVCEEVDEACKQIRLRQVEKRVEYINSRLIKLEKLVRIQLIDFGTGKEDLSAETCEKIFQCGATG